MGYPDEKEEGGWKELFLGLDKCNYLNGEGIYTAVNWDGGMKSWGGRIERVSLEHRPQGLPGRHPPILQLVPERVRT